ncbi:LOW QUALITY PROTEIN: hypothetical protein ElyMa_004337500 [Elysia marginata]|uniref:Kinesin-like protein KIF26A/B helical domain-containing protein n=1 Tax=Elysia marginata TaxID=1093978 RepID=A0AAV4H2H7_9GAST|nr:LOW QUALITY PROTEIN: hypothetical protein ElyMa_004337500 [Elysia marginata]
MGDRGRPSRSGIPTPVGSHLANRAGPGHHVTGQHHIYSTPDSVGGTAARRGRGDTHYHSPSRSTARQSSPRSSSRHAHNHLHGNAHEGRHNKGADRKDDLLERSVVGCESSSDPYADPDDLTLVKPTPGRLARPDGEETLTWPEEANGQFDKPMTAESAGEKSAFYPDRAVSLTDAEEPAAKEKVGGGQQTAPVGPPSGTAQGVAVTSSGRGGEVAGSLENRSIQSDYPIRGTISPLSGCSKVAVKRSVGPVDEVSFVFGRPASPGPEAQIAYPSSGYFRNRCVPASSLGFGARGFPRKSGRARSPSSDVLPARREGLEASRARASARRVLSPPPALGSAMAECRLLSQGRASCDQCNSCLVELKRQALRLMFPDSDTDAHLAQVSGFLGWLVSFVSRAMAECRLLSQGRASCDQCNSCLVELKRQALRLMFPDSDTDAHLAQVSGFSVG